MERLRQGLLASDPAERAQAEQLRDALGGAPEANESETG